MRKLSIILLLSILISSGCTVFHDRIYPLGTTEAEFKSKDKWLITMVEQSEERTVYKKLTGQDNNRNTYLYYYFVDGKLVRMDEGERQPNVVIEHVKS